MYWPGFDDGGGGGGGEPPWKNGGGAIGLWDLFCLGWNSNWRRNY